MYNAVNDFIKASVILVAAMAISNCSNGDHNHASTLLDKAKILIDDNLPDSALAVLDSLDNKYPEQIEIRREAMALRANAMTLSLEKKIFETDSIIIVYQDVVDILMPLFEHAEVEGANGYYYMKGAYGPGISLSSGVQARLSDIDFSFYIVAANSGDKIGINQITLSSPAGKVSSSEIPASDSRRGDTDKYGTDFATFSSSEADTLGAWAYYNGNIITSATITGSLGSRDFALSGPQSEQFGNTWRLGVAGSKLYAARRLKEKLERQVIISRDHAVNLMPDQTHD